MHPAIFEALILALMGVSGVGAGLLLGIRQAIPLAIVALATSTVARVWSAFAVWSLGRPELNFEVWIGISLLAFAVAAVVSHKDWLIASKAIALFGGLAIVALFTKYVLDVGERHHSDVSQNLGMAIVLFQGDSEDLEPAAKNFKRGIAYPLMLGLGPEDRILSAFTPMVFLTTLLLAGWLARELLDRKVGTGVLLGVGAAVAVFSITVPMFRVSMFYLNGHSLMGFGVLLLVGGVALALRAQKFDRVPIALTLLGGVIGITARIEGVVLVLVVLAVLVSKHLFVSLKTRLQLFSVLALIGLSLAWWLIALESPVFQRLGIPTGTEWVLLILSLAGAALVASPFVDSFRKYFALATSAIIVFGLLVEVWQSGNPVGLVLAQWPNLGLGAGGWGTAAHVFVGSALLLGVRRRSSDYRLLLTLSVLLIGAILYSKTFDGGFGREGFYDSVNRMWLHVMPTILLAALMGYAELVHKAFGRDSEAAEVSRNSEKVSTAN